MFTNYLTAAYRNLVKKKFFALINVLGLAVGMAACLLIFQYVFFEYSFDNFNTNRDTLYRVTQTNIRNGEVGGTSALTSFMIGPVFESDVPELAEYARFHPITDRLSFHTPIRGENEVY